MWTKTLLFTRKLVNILSHSAITTPHHIISTISKKLVSILNHSEKQDHIILYQPHRKSF